MKQRITHHATRVILVATLVTLPGCQRPPVPEKTSTPGPPTVAQISPLSPEGKALEAARKQPHDNWVPSPGAKGESQDEEAGAKSNAPKADEKPAEDESKANAKTGDARDAATGSRVTAASQAGRKGEGYGLGLISTPIGVYFGAKERIAIMHLEEQLKLWTAQNGRPPKDTEEFMEKVVKPAGIKLPELRDGERYVFDPKKGPSGTLMIEQKQAAGSAAKP